MRTTSISPSRDWGTIGEKNQGTVGGIGRVLAGGFGMFIVRRERLQEPALLLVEIAIELFCRELLCGSKTQDLTSLAE